MVAQIFDRIIKWKRVAQMEEVETFLPDTKDAEALLDAPSPKRYVFSLFSFLFWCISIITAVVGGTFIGSYPSRNPDALCIKHTSQYCKKKSHCLPGTVH
jgi:uncharacterized membrane protein